MMKIYLLLATLLALLPACNSTSSRNSSDPKKTLTVTIEPQRFFLEQLVKDEFKINVLVPPGTSPETYEPAPSVIVELSQSDMYFRVGDLGFENAWSEKLVENNPEVVVVNCSQGIEMHAGHAHEGHDHEEHSCGETDPHVWSSPNAMKVFSKNMADALIRKYPEKTKTFQENLTQLLQKINETDSVIQTILADSPTKAFIIYHPALGYFADQYGLHQHSIEFEGKSPSPAQLKELVDIARAENIRTVFVQQGFDIKNAEVVAKEIGAEAIKINPLAYEWDEELIRTAKLLANPSK